MPSKSQSYQPRLTIMADVWHQIRRSPYQAIVVVLTIGFTLYAMSIFASMAAGSEEVIRHFEGKPQVIAFYNIDDTPAQEQVDIVINDLQATGIVKDIEYVSQEEALEIYRQQNAQDPQTLEYVTANILPASIEVSAYQPTQLAAIAEKLSSYEGIEDVIFQEDVVDELTKWTSSLRQVGLEMVGFMGVLTFMIIFITMSTKIALRRPQIKILKLLGATNGYIQRPYIIEAAIYGILGGIVGWGAAYTRILYATPFLLDLFSFLGGLPQTLQLEWMLIMLAIEVGASMILSMIATWFATSRFLHRYH